MDIYAFLELLISNFNQLASLREWMHPLNF